MHSRSIVITSLLIASVVAAALVFLMMKLVDIPAADQYTARETVVVVLTFSLGMPICYLVLLKLSVYLGILSEEEERSALLDE